MFRIDDIQKWRVTRGRMMPARRNVVEQQLRSAPMTGASAQTPRSGLWAFNRLLTCPKQYRAPNCLLRRRPEHKEARRDVARHAGTKRRCCSCRQGCKDVPFTTNIVLFTPSGAPLASERVKLYLRSWGDWPTMEPTMKLLEVCGVRNDSD
jgi:hypothetical protein